MKKDSNWVKENEEKIILFYKNTELSVHDTYLHFKQECPNILERQVRNILTKVKKETPFHKCMEELYSLIQEDSLHSFLIQSVMYKHYPTFITKTEDFRLIQHLGMFDNQYSRLVNNLKSKYKKTGKILRIKNNRLFYSVWTCNEELHMFYDDRKLLLSLTTDKQDPPIEKYLEDQFETVKLFLGRNSLLGN